MIHISLEILNKVSQLIFLYLELRMQGIYLQLQSCFFINYAVLLTRRLLAVRCIDDVLFFGRFDQLFCIHIDSNILHGWFGADNLQFLLCLMSEFCLLLELST